MLSADDKPTHAMLSNQQNKQPAPQCHGSLTLVFKSGDSKGLAYVGALQALEEKIGEELPGVQRMAGTSSGAITDVANDTRSVFYKTTWSRT